MNYCDQYLAKIRDSKVSHVIYGADILAEKITEFLKKNGIDVEAYIVDKKYWKEGAVFCDRPVFSVEDYFADHVADVTLGVTKLTDEQIAALQKMENVTEVYAYDLLGAMALDVDILNVIDDHEWDERKEEWAQIRELFVDEASKKAFDLYIMQKRTGAYRKDYSRQPQYFDPEIIHLTDDEVFLDCGAYRGETQQAFLESCKQQGVEPGFSYLFEPDEKNVEYMKSMSLQNACVIPGGVWDQDTVLYFDSEGNTNTRVSEIGNSSITVSAIDNLEEINTVSFIKMDIEGSEMRALKGAKETIMKYRPKLAICVYHKKEDLLEIPAYIRSLVPQYRFYLRNYASSGVETVLYAVMGNEG